MDNKKIGKFIAIQRKSLSMTQQDIADKLDITNRAVSKWETGEGYPDISILPALSEILEVSIDEILKGEKNESSINVSNPYCIKENIQQAKYLLDKSIRLFDNNYVISIGILCIGIIVSNLSLKLYNGFQYSSLSYSIMISLSFLIIGFMLYNNFCKGVKSDIEKFNKLLDEKVADYYKIVNKRHSFFYAIYLIQIMIFIYIIPLYPYRSMGYYAAFKKIYGYSSQDGRFLIDNNVFNILTLMVYCILLCVGILIITKKMRCLEKQ